MTTYNWEYSFDEIPFLFPNKTGFWVFCLQGFRDVQMAQQCRPVASIKIHFRVTYRLLTSFQIMKYFRKFLIFQSFGIVPKPWICLPELMSTFLPQSASTPVNTSSDCPLGHFVHILMWDQQQHHDDFLTYKLQMHNWQNSVLFSNTNLAALGRLIVEFLQLNLYMRLSISEL